MRTLVNRWRRWLERPLHFAQDPQRPVAEPMALELQEAQKEDGALAASAVGAVGRVRFKSQRRSFSIITANVTSWRSGRHDLEQELLGFAVIQEHHLAHADNITTAQSGLARLGFQSVSIQLSPPRLAKGTFGGVAVVIRSHVGVTPHRGLVKMTHTDEARVGLRFVRVLEHMAGFGGS